MDVQKPLRRGIFVAIEEQKTIWVPFKFENLPIFCFECVKMTHGVTECVDFSEEEKQKLEDDFPYSVTLKVKSRMMGKENFQIGRLRR